MSPFDSDEAAPNPSDDEPTWDPSGWSPVYFGDPGRPEARLLGHTQLQLIDGVDRFKVSFIHPESKEWYLGGDLLKVPDKRSGKMLWAWRLMNMSDLPHVPDFRPLPN